MIYMHSDIIYDIIVKLLILYSIELFFKLMSFLKCFLKVSNELDHLTFAGILFHSLGAATE